jgi:hypothetical protein
LLGLDEDQSIAHELVHRVTHVAWGEIPVALDEAFAEYLSAGVLADGRWHPGVQSPNRLEAVDLARKQDALPSIPELFDLSPGEFAEMGLVARGTGGLLIEFLHEKERLRPFVDALTKRLPVDGAGTCAALAEAWGDDLPALERVFRAWLDQQDAYWAYARGAELVERGEGAEARVQFERAVELAPKQGVFWHALSTARTVGGDRQRAASALERAERCPPFPGRRGVMLALAHGYLEDGLLDEAIPLYEEILATGLAPHAAYGNFAACLRGSDRERALALVEAGLQLPRDGLFVSDQVEKLELLRDELRAGAQGR